MKLRTRKREFQDPGESGAMSDLAFLLIIYFMVIAGFQLNQGFLLGLPERGSTTWVHQEDLAVVRMDVSGALSLQGREFPADEAFQLIGELVEHKPNLTVQLKIHPEAEYQQVVDFISMVHRLQIDNFSFDIQEAS